MTQTPQQQPQFDREGLSQIIFQLKELVRIAMDCKDRELKEGVSLVDVSREVAKLRIFVDAMQRSQQEAHGAESTSEQDKQQIQKKIEALPDREKELFEDLRQLQSTCETARDELYKSLQDNKSTLKQVEDTFKDESAKKVSRKNKFRGIGSKDGWIPS